MMQIRLLISKFQTVTTLDLEDYLKCVVPSEMGGDWPIEALKVQAYCARSYGLYAMLRPRHSIEGADVCDSPRHCQVFNVDKRHENADKAVIDTTGLILAYRGQIVDAVYSACCGGHTRNNEQVWKRGAPVAYLRGVECPCDGQQKRGHGVGMCQEGAKVLAAAGKTAIEILQHYYGNEVEVVPIGDIIKPVTGTDVP